jgi:hypothetical protein
MSFFATFAPAHGAIMVWPDPPRAAETGQLASLRAARVPGARRLLPAAYYRPLSAVYTRSGSGCFTFRGSPTD